MRFIPVARPKYAPARRIRIASPERPARGRARASNRNNRLVTTSQKLAAEQESVKMTDDLREKLREIIIEVAEIDEVPDDIPFKDLGIDSMMAIEVINEVERLYQIKVPEEELEEIVDLNSVVALIQRKLEAAGS
jgi:acyl carrier protein